MRILNKESRIREVRKALAASSTPTEINASISIDKA
jgi:hypothetical protein